MKGEEFDRQFETLVAKPLSGQGFERHGRSLSLTRDTTVLALIRLRIKADGLSQQAHYQFCIRHGFLRTEEGNLPHGFVARARDYPFRLPVLSLSAEMMPLWRTPRWRYQPISRFPPQYDTVAFGMMHDASGMLGRMTKGIKRYGRRWMSYLTPERALAQLRRHGEGAGRETIWIADYESFLGRRLVSEASGR